MNKDPHFWEWIQRIGIVDLPSWVKANVLFNYRHNSEIIEVFSIADKWKFNTTQAWSYVTSIYPAELDARNDIDKLEKVLEKKAEKSEKIARVIQHWEQRKFGTINLEN